RLVLGEAPRVQRDASSGRRWSRCATGATVDGVTNQLPGAVGTVRSAASADAPSRAFEMRFTSTPRGARLARRLSAHRLDAWGVPYGTGPHEEIVVVVGELTANAVRHGHVGGRDFHLRMEVTGVPRHRAGRGHRHAGRPDPARKGGAAGAGAGGRGGPGAAPGGGAGRPLGLVSAVRRPGQDGVGGVPAPGLRVRAEAGAA